jgi:hypothetical protein
MTNVFLILLSISTIYNCEFKKNYKEKTENNLINKYNYGENRNNFNVKFDSLFMIFPINDSLFQSFQDVFTDRFDNIYISDKKNMCIYKYDCTGKLLTTISKHGIGPGELVSFSNAFIQKDTLRIIDNKRKSVLNFMLDGTFLYRFEIKEKDFIEKIEVIDDSLLVAQTIRYKIQPDKIDHITNISLFDNRFNKKHDLTQNILENFSNNTIHLTPLNKNYFCVSKSNIYIGIKDINKYQFKEYSLDGKLLSNINNKYHKVIFPEKDYMMYYSEKLKDPYFSKYLDKLGKCKFSYDNIYAVDEKLIFLLRYESFFSKYVYFDVFQNGEFFKSIKFNLPQFDNVPHEATYNRYRFHFKDNKCILLDINNMLVIYSISFEK